MVRRAAVVMVAALGLAAPAPAAARVSWGRPFDLAPPGALDISGPALAISSTGVAAAGFSTQDVDTPGTEQAFLSRRAAGGGVAGPTPLAGAAEILSLAYDGRSLELLAGATPAGLTCCASAEAIPVGAGGSLGRPRTLVGGLTGDTLGHLVTLADGQMLAAVATERGVWVVQSPRSDRFAATHRLTGAGRMPESLAVAALGGERSLVAWTAGTGPAGAADPRTIVGATGSRLSAPRRSKTLVTVPAGHRIDESGVAPRGAGQATVAWIESWFDKGGAYHSVVRALDLGAAGAARTLSPAGRLASGLSVAGDTAGDAAVAWQSCTINAACTVQASLRRHGGAFGPVRTLGGADATQTPALSVGPGGATVVGWIQGGDPVAAMAAEPGRGFGAPARLSSAGYALNIAVTAGAGGRALAAWSQGTLNPSVVGVAGSGL